MARAPRSTTRQGDEAAPARQRILDAAFAAFVKQGYAATSMLEIATTARVSKRELYALVGNKQQMLVACITERARRLRMSDERVTPRDRATLAQLLVAFGTQTLREVTDPAVIAVFRLAIAEAINAPEVARVLNAIGRQTARAGLVDIMRDAEGAGLVAGRPAELAEQFAGLLWGDWMLSLLLGVIDRPGATDIADRTRVATAAFLRLHPQAG
jgi:AcrR family transcriptional regulator